MIMCRDSDGLLARSIAGVCVCVHSCFQGHYSSFFLIYPTNLSVQKQGDNPMDAVGCPTKRAAFHG